MGFRWAFLVPLILAWFGLDPFISTYERFVHNAYRRYIFPRSPLLSRKLSYNLVYSYRVNHAENEQTKQTKSQDEQGRTNTHVRKATKNAKNISPSNGGAMSGQAYTTFGLFFNSWRRPINRSDYSWYFRVPSKT